MSTPIYDQMFDEASDEVTDLLTTARSRVEKGKANDTTKSVGVQEQNQMGTDRGSAAYRFRT